MKAKYQKQRDAAPPPIVKGARWVPLTQGLFSLVDEEDFEAIDAHSGLWKAQIGFSRKRLNLGRFSSETDAAIAYNEAVVRLFGQFACCNEIRL